MRRVTAIVVLLLVTGLSGTAWGGVCGDVDGDGVVDISDMVQLLVYVGSNGKDQPAPPNPIDADVDGHAGLTMADVAVLTDWIFAWPQGTGLQCTQAQVYSFAASSTDSVFFPRMLSVPEGVDTVVMPVYTYMDASTHGVYLPFLGNGPGTANFGLNKVMWNSVPSWDIINYSNFQNYSHPDTCSIVATPYNMPNPEFTGRHALASLVYVRTAPGTGAIAPMLINWTSLLRPSVEKNGDLFVPNTQYYDFAFPPETLIVSTGSLNFDAVAGYPSTDSFLVTFTSSGLPISFSLTPTEPWITIVDTGAVGFRTPAAVLITADATQTGIGNYAAQISFSSLNPSAPTTVPYIDISMTVRAPNIYPFGDLDCDGVVDISDLSKLIDHLFMSLTPLTPCQP